MLIRTIILFFVLPLTLNAQTVHFVRHAEKAQENSFENTKQLDSHGKMLAEYSRSISPQGVKTAEKLRDFFEGKKLSAIITSQKLRAQQTAEPLLNDRNELTGNAYISEGLGRGFEIEHSIPEAKKTPEQRENARFRGVLLDQLENQFTKDDVLLLVSHGEVIPFILSSLVPRECLLKMPMEDYEAYGLVLLGYDGHDTLITVDLGSNDKCKGLTATNFKKKE